MKPNTTELVFIIDRSGSMSGLESDTIGGLNSMLEKQKAIEGECKLTTVLFNHEYQLLHDRMDLGVVKSLTENDYEVGGCTAMIDAIGHSIQKIINAQAQVDPANRPGKVLFVIITDGLENASHYYNVIQVRKMIETQKVLHDWEFLFLGANIDAVETAEHFGISRDHAQDFHSDPQGVQKF
ncbi:MAG: VWA domain-containing protein [Tissierellia bacterium]|nr:VWA domain-containing protein [Tissierellia bacterium]